MIIRPKLDFYFMGKKYTNKNYKEQRYIDVKHDLSLYGRFHESVKILATNTGSLNKRLFDCYYYFLFPFQCEHFKEKELEQRLQYIIQIMTNPNKCSHYEISPGGNLHCHWKESKKLAENIFYIYNHIVNTQNEK